MGTWKSLASRTHGSDRAPFVLKTRKPLQRKIGWWRCSRPDNCRNVSDKILRAQHWKCGPDSEDEGILADPEVALLGTKCTGKGEVESRGPMGSRLGKGDDQAMN